MVQKLSDNLDSAGISLPLLEQLFEDLSFSVLQQLPCSSCQPAFSFEFLFLSVQQDVDSFLLVLSF